MASKLHCDLCDVVIEGGWRVAGRVNIFENQKANEAVVEIETCEECTKRLVSQVTTKLAV